MLLRNRDFWSYVVVVAAWAALHLALLLTIENSPLDNRLGDTDSYMRLVRITELVDGEGWYDGVIERGNAPYGETLHWTRPFDVLVVGLALPMMPMLGQEDALFWAGALSCPLLHLGILLVMVWAAQPLLGRRSGLLVVVLIVQPALLGAGFPGRLDHHALQLLLYATLIGLGIRVLALGQRQLAWPAGVVAGLGAWVSIEMLIPAVTLPAMLALLWMQGRDLEARTALSYSLALTATMASALLIERPLSSIASVEADRISLQHVVAAMVMMGIWLGATRATGVPALSSSGRRRLASLSVMTGVSTAALLLVFPGALLGPGYAVDPAIQEIWLDKVAEMQPLWPTSLVRVGRFIMFAGQASAFFAIAVVMTYHKRTTDLFYGWVFIGLLLGIYLVLTVQHLRFASFLALPTSIVVAYSIAWLAQSIPRDRIRIMRSFVWVGAAAASIGGPSLAGAAISAQTMDTIGDFPRFCHIEDIAATLEASPGLGDENLVIAATIDLGPQLLYYTDHRTIAGPYHRNASGITDLHKMFVSEPEVSRQLVERRGVDLFLICPSHSELAFIAGDQVTEKSTYFLLFNSAPPEWLRPVVITGADNGGFSIYEVVR